MFVITIWFVCVTDRCPNVCYRKVLLKAYRHAPGAVYRQVSQFVLQEGAPNGHTDMLLVQFRQVSQGVLQKGTPYGHTDMFLVQFTDRCPKVCYRKVLLLGIQTCSWCSLQTGVPMCVTERCS